MCRGIIVYDSGIVFLPQSGFVQQNAQPDRGTSVPLRKCWRRWLVSSALCAIDMFNPREAQLDFIVTRSAISALVLLTLAFVCSFTYKDGIRYALINLSPVVTSGVITETKDSSKYQDNFIVDYVFTDELSNNEITGRYIQKKRFDKGDYIVGSSINIISSKYFSKHNFIEHRLYQLEISFSILLVGSVIALFLILFLIWNTYQYFHFKSEAKQY